MGEQSWPEGGLEAVPDCPICSSANRTLLYEGLSDRIFFVAPGEWSLWQCAECQSVWLDPRPTQATIGLAYRDYYTHEEMTLPEPRTAFQRLRAALGNGYRNRRYGTLLGPASPLGPLLATLVPALGWPVDVAYRFLPPPSRRGRCVLDVGCGNGSWLELASGAGWHIAGVEPDPISRRQARDRGIEVRKSIADWLDEPESFDYVTIGHVIEHVHDPLGLLLDSFTLLRPGGGLYVDTPNIDAIGHEIYRRHWRGLEPPRHLVLFNRDSLTDAVSRSGFDDVRFHARPDAFAFTSAQSQRMAMGLDPYASDASTDLTPSHGPIQRLRAMTGRRVEFLTLTATKPR